jgi:uncharacterized membrane protein YphA (DoxX/SURF4 family)
MQLARKIGLNVLILLSVATGGVKLFSFEADIEVFASIGFSPTATLLFGVVQVIGGLLLIFDQTRKIGAGVMALTFVIATIALFASGTTAFGVFSILFILLALVPFLPERQAPALAN